MRIIVGLGIAIAFAGGALAADPVTAPVTVPGVTLQAVRLTKGVSVPNSNASQSLPRTVFADAAGRTLYTYGRDVAGVSACVDACTKSFPPLAAPADAKPVGDWSIIARTDGIRQWAHEGRPLYTSANDKAIGNVTGHNVDDLWHAALMEPPRGVALPTEIMIEEVLDAPGLVLVDARGMPLYGLDAKAKDKAVAAEWSPVRAPALALPVGDFTAVKRGNGIVQWAYKGNPLFTYKWDVERNDANGKGVDQRLGIAVVRSYFMPAGVDIRPNQKRGGVLVTAGDQTLYARDRTGYTGNAAHSARGGYKGYPLVGQAIGVSGCDAACERTWQPLKAPADAQPSGFWSAVTRPDGAKQWAYQGYALYTYTAEKPGELTGHDKYDFAINHSTTEIAAASATGALGLYWRATSP